MQRVELHARGIIQGERREVADRGAKFIHAGNDAKLGDRSQEKHCDGKDVSGSEWVWSSVDDAA